MKTIVITQPGAPEVLQVQQRPMPACSVDEVLVKVAAAGVNSLDVSQRKGEYPPPPGASPDIPGLEIAGTIATHRPFVCFFPNEKMRFHLYSYYRIPGKNRYFCINEYG